MQGRVAVCERNSILQKLVGAAQRLQRWLPCTIDIEVNGAGRPFTRYALEIGVPGGAGRNCTESCHELFGIEGNRYWPVWGSAEGHAVDSPLARQNHVKPKVCSDHACIWAMMRLRIPVLKGRWRKI